MPHAHGGVGETEYVNQAALPASANKSLSISIGHFPLTLHFMEEDLQPRAAARYASFRVRHSVASSFPVYLQPASGSARATNCFSFQHVDALVRLASGAAYFHGVRHEYALDSLLRILLTQLLLPQNGFLLHAATITRGGRGYVFVGRSGAGKSTVAALSPAASALTDEISLLRRDGENWFGYGTPFWGEFRADGANRRVPVAGIFSLVQANVNSVERLSVKQALTAMLPNVLFFSTAPRENSDLLALLAQAAQRVRFYRLLFRNEPSFWEAIPE